MKFQKHFDEGLKSLKKGDFLNAITNFEECLTYDKNDYLIYYYLGITYIFRENYENAYKYLLQAYKLNAEDTSVLNAIAFINLKEGNVQEAINYWLDGLDIEPKNIIIKRNLERIKKAKNVDKLVETVVPEDFIGFRVRMRVSWKFFNLEFLKQKKKLYIILSIIIFIIILTVIPLVFDNRKEDNIRYKEVKVKIQNKKNIDDIKLPDIKEDYIEDKSIKKSLFKFSKSDVIYLFERCKRYIESKEYNSAIIIINKILHSTLSFPIKERFKILLGFIPQIKEFKVKDNIQYSEIMNLPTIYEGVNILWQGKVDDIEILENKNESYFNFIVRENGDTAGVVIAYMKQIMPSLKNGDSIELLGKFVGIKEGTRMPFISVNSIKVME